MEESKPTEAKQEANDAEEFDDEQDPDAEEDVEDDEEKQDGDEDYNPLNNEKQEVVQFDTTEEFASVFGEKTEFDSWEEFTKLLEEFQKRTGTFYKPRSACSVDYANERRINSPIDDRFVYSNVKMICIHFGTSPKRASQRRSYVGRGCGAFMNVSYNKGALRITQSHLIHNNHAPGVDDPAQQRQLRVFNFNEELDLIICREVMRVNPFVFTNGEKQWIQAVERLKNEDERFANITPRLVKKRIRFLVDKFMAITHGRRPPAEDEMGCILYELDRTRKDTLDSPATRGRKKRGPGRPRKKRVMTEDEDFDEEDFISETSSVTQQKKRLRSSPSTPQPSSEISSLLTYLQSKDEEDRRLRQKEIDLRREELSFQKQRFEFEKIERKAHLDLLKAQVQAFEHSVSNKQVQVQAMAPKEGNQVEYTIVVDNNSQVLNSMPTLG